jgi:hypothetical protein
MSLTVDPVTLIVAASVVGATSVVGEVPTSAIKGLHGVQEVDQEGIQFSRNAASEMALDKYE